MSALSKDYMAAEWQRIFEFNGLRSFADFWEREVEWFESPNQRRGGWSGVARCELKLPEGGTRSVFLKRQENHVTRTAAHPFRGIPTFVREFRGILRYQRLRIPSLTPLYFAVRRTREYQRAVLLTEELEGYRSLESLSREWASQGWPSLQIRYRIIEAVAQLLRRIHRSHLSHNCFYAKHVFLRFTPGDGVEARVIDLEKTKWAPFGMDRHYRDLRRLYGDCQVWRRSDQVRFLRAYLGLKRLTPSAKAAWRRIARFQLKRMRARAAVAPATDPRH